MATVPISKASRNLSHWVNKAGYGGEAITLTSHGKPKAVILSIDDFKALLGVPKYSEEEAPSWSEIQAEWQAAAAKKGVHTRKQILELIADVKREMAAEKDAERVAE